MSDKILNSLKGFIIGDSFGVPYEFKKSSECKNPTWVGFMSHNQPKGIWSDDTSMLLATIDSLILKER